MDLQNATLWQVIEELEQQLPFTRQNVEKTLGVQLQEKQRNEFTVFYEGKGVALGDNTSIAKIDFRLIFNSSTPNFLVLDIIGKPIALEPIRKQYGALEITDSPRGRSLNEQTVYTAKRKWGKLSFGFKASAPKDLATVIFDQNPK